jgi:hypothetical protein
MSELTIERNKERIVSIILFLIIFNVLSAFMIYNPDFFVSGFMRISFFIFIIGIISFTFTLAMIVSHIALLLSKEKGIILTDSGIVDNSNYESLGFIKWEDISHIKTIKQYSGNYLEVTIKNKKKYMTNDKKMNLLKRFLIFMNNWHPNETIILSDKKLDCTFQELETMVIEKWQNKNIDLLQG